MYIAAPPGTKLLAKYLMPPEEFKILEEVDFNVYGEEKSLAILQFMRDLKWIYISYDEGDKISLKPTETGIEAEKEIRALRTSGEGSVFSLKFDFYPSRAAFDGDRDLLLVIGTDELETDINTRIAFFSFPDCRMIQAVSVKGNAESVRYDELEDSFRILQNNPGQVLTLSPSLGLDKFHSFSLGDEKGVTFEVCPTEKKIVVGTLNGKILSLDSEEKGFKVLASFKEPVSKIMYNPLVNHLYVAFKESRNLAVIDMEIARIREVVRCSSEVSELAFDEKHNKIYALLAGISSIEIYLDQGR